MNKTKLKAYAPKARKDFIAAVTARANLLGLSDKGGNLEVAVGERKGDIAIIAGREWPVKVYSQREDLIMRMKNEGFNHTVEAVAYTWFNRFAALRYMEIHDYLDHGHRALSNREGGMPEILNHAAELDLPGLNKAKAIELKLAGNKDNDLYKLILVAQCNALSSAMPFLFERIDDETELLLPDNLLLTDSVIAKLVADIPEEDWQEVEIIGWLYQFYISEKKDEVIGKVVKSEDIPAATQLFTPNWIVQYLVQNSVGRLWMMANPSSTLKSQWQYYIEPAEQTPEVNAQLDGLIKTRMDEDGGSLNPETITVLDPACGSGHILVVAYDVLKAIYLERGYQPRAIPRLILEKNIYGIDIDDRAAQMAGFALLMKARADDRRLFDNSPNLNVLPLQDCEGLHLDELASNLQPHGVNRIQLSKLLDAFTHAKTFGSLIQIPRELNAELASMSSSLQNAIQKGDLYAQAAVQDLLPLVQQAKILGMTFDAVVANPPYMGFQYYCPSLKQFVLNFFPEGKNDLYTVFMLRNAKFSKASGHVAMITIPNWMFLSEHENLRSKVLLSTSLSSLIHNGRGVWGSDFGSCSFVFLASKIDGLVGTYKKLFDRFGEVSSSEELDSRFTTSSSYYVKADDFSSIPGSPFAYWTPESLRSCFSSSPKSIEEVAPPRQGIKTGDNDTFLKYWYEISINKTSISSKENYKWVPCSKGGPFRRWYGNCEYVLNWENDGNEIKNFKTTEGKLRSRPQNIQHFFRTGITWSTVSISSPSMRLFPVGWAFESAGSVCFPIDENNLYGILGFLNSKIVTALLSALAPSVSFPEGALAKLPVNFDPKKLGEAARTAVEISKIDWDSQERSWDFKIHPWLSVPIKSNGISKTWKNWQDYTESRVCTLKLKEEENNRLFIEAYGLQDELSPEVHEDRITLSRADREKDCQRLITYAIGCMMGRYSLDESGLIYAHASNVGFEPSRYTTFPADADGIVPITDTLWFEDDAANRIREFLIAVWTTETVDENMAWLADSLGNKGNETTEETIRRYLAGSFYKNHLQTYKKRPIYWLFSSGKQGAFQALVYLHRYNEGTLARMRSEYVVPLTGKMLSRIEMLEKDAASEASTAARTKINKEIEVLRKQHIELLAYDEKLRHYADMRIQLNLDDGVKVNYGKFGDLLAEVKAITGGADE